MMRRNPARRSRASSLLQGRPSVCGEAGASSSLWPFSRSPGAAASKCDLCGHQLSPQVALPEAAAAVRCATCRRSGVDPLPEIGNDLELAPESWARAVSDDVAVRSATRRGTDADRLPAIDADVNLTPPPWTRVVSDDAAVHRSRRRPLSMGALRAAWRPDRPDGMPDVQASRADGSGSGAAAFRLDLSPLSWARGISGGSPDVSNVPTPVSSARKHSKVSSASEVSKASRLSRISQCSLMMSRQESKDTPPVPPHVQKALAQATNPSEYRRIVRRLTVAEGTLKHLR